MGANLRWFTACGAPEHFNACLKTFSWYFVEFLSKSLRKDVPVPYAQVPEDCSNTGENPTEDPKDPVDPVEDPTDPKEDPNDPVEDPSDPKDDPAVDPAVK